jgi:transposase-like protein
MPRHRLLAPYLTGRHWTVADARSALAAWEASGISMLAFAAREGVDVHRLYRWRRRLAVETITAEPTPEFVELRPRGAEPVEVVLRSGRVLRVSEAIDPSVLIRLVAALERSESC